MVNMRTMLNTIGTFRVADRLMRTAVRLPVIVALIAMLPAAVGSVAAAEHGERAVAYVPNAADGTVSAIDIDRAELLWELRISDDTDNRPAEAAHGIAVSPDGRELYVGDRAAGELVIIDLDERAVDRRIPIDHDVHGIDISPDGSMVWVASVSSNLVWNVDAERREATQVVALPPRAMEMRETDAPEAAAGNIGINEVAVAPDGRRAYAVGPASARLFAIDLESGQKINSVQGEARAHGVVVSADGSEVWVANRSGSVSVFDADTLEQLATIETGAYANHVAALADGKRMLVTEENELIVIDRAERRIVARVAVGADPHEIAVSIGRAAGTHFGDLFQFDVEELAEVRIDGSEIAGEFEWRGDQETGHHRYGVLVLRPDDPGETSTRLSPGAELELRLRAIGTEVRFFEWEL